MVHEKIFYKHTISIRSEQKCRYKCSSHEQSDTLDGRRALRRRRPIPCSAVAALSRQCGAGVVLSRAVRQRQRALSCVVRWWRWRRRPGNAAAATVPCPGQCSGGGVVVVLTVRRRASSSRQGDVVCVECGGGRRGVSETSKGRRPPNWV